MLLAALHRRGVIVVGVAAAAYVVVGVHNVDADDGDGCLQKVASPVTV